MHNRLVQVALWIIALDQGCEVCKCVTFVGGVGRNGRSTAWLSDVATDV